MTDLWPTELATVDTKSPLTILKEQAALLGEKTKNVVIAEVDPGSPLIWNKGKVFHPFTFGFSLSCPALGNYQFRLFSISYGIDFYPVYFQLDRDIAEEIRGAIDLEVNEEGSTQAASEEEYVEALRLIFGSRKTLRVIGAMLSQAGAK